MITLTPYCTLFTRLQQNILTLLYCVLLTANSLPMTFTFTSSLTFGAQLQSLSLLGPSFDYRLRLFHHSRGWHWQWTDWHSPAK